MPNLTDIGLTPIPSDLNPEDFSALTEKRQKVLISLWYKEKKLSEIANEKDISVSTVDKALRDLRDQGLVEKDEESKLHTLTEKGKDLALMVAEPNGYGEEDYREMLEKRFKDRMIKNGSEEEEAEIEAKVLARRLREVQIDLNNSPKSDRAEA